MAMTQKRPKVGDTSRDTSPEGDQVISMVENSEVADLKESVNSTEDVTSVPQFWYTKTELLDIAKNPLSKKRPSCLDPAYNNALGTWDPEKWFVGKRRAESPLPEDSKSKREKPPDLDRESLFKRRPSDPKERLKDEQDNIILSPQRRSFGTGCHVSQQSSSRRPESPCELRGIDRESHREPNRRIGSGRIISRDRDNRQERDFGFRNNERRERDRFDRDEREIRFSNRNNREFPERKNRGRHQRIEEEEEPEWFSSGPTSQSETIELHGFEDSPEKDWDDKEEGVTKEKRWRRGSWRKTKPVIEENGIPEEDEKEEEETGENKQVVSRSPSVASQIAKTASGQQKDNAKTQSNENTTFGSLPQEFDLNKWFECEPISTILPNGTPPETSRGSRFSQWFHPESPVPVTAESGSNSRRSSQHDELVGNLINDINEPSVMIPSPGTNSETYFEPISPAQTSDNSKNILELLHGAPVETYVKNENLKNSNLQDLVVTGQAQNVQEIEAGLKQLVLGSRVSNNTNTNNNIPNGSSVPVCRSNEGDLSAFKKLLVQISEGQAHTHTAQQGMHFSPLDKTRMLHEKDLVQIVKSQKADNPVPVVGRQSPVTFNNKSNLMRLLQDAPTEEEILAGHDKRHSPPQQQSTANQPGNSYSDFLMQILQQHQQQSQQQQSQSSMPSQRPTTQDNALTKLLTSSSTSSASPLRPCSPGMQDLLANQIKRQSNDRSDLTTYSSGNVNQLSRNQIVPQQHIPNKLLQQQQQQRQHQREILATIVKQQQQQQQQLQQAATAAVAGTQLQPQIIQPSVSPPTNLLQTGLNRSLSPRPTSPHAPDTLQQALFQSSQPRIPSPLIFGQTPPLIPHAPSPIHPNQVAPAIAPIGATLNPNSLQVYSNPLIQRVPSPQELVLHTQQIMQNALIKSKLEEQKENYRKRQEMQNRTRSPNVQNSKLGSEGSPSKGTSLSTTMAAFTPTSVMRKMQAEKDKDGVKMDAGSQLTVGNKTNDSKLSFQQQHLKSQNVGNGIPTSESDKIPRPLHGQGLMHSHLSARGPSALNPSQQGRAIVKGNQGLNPSLLTNKNTGVQNQKLGVGTGSLSNAQNKNANNNSNYDMNKILEQQRLLQNAQRQLNVSPMPASSIPHAAYPIRGGGAIHPNIARSGVNIPPNLLIRSMVHPNLNQAAIRAQLNQLALLQQHAMDPHRLNLAHSATLQHLLLGTAATPRSQPPSINLPNPAVGMTAPKTDTQPFNHLQSGNISNSNLNNNFGMGNTLGAGGNIGNPSTNRHSPINNLSKWFNSDVLKQKLPDLPPVPTQKALSLEEVERRQQQTTVHN